MYYRNGIQVMHGCPICLEVISPRTVACGCGHIGHHNIKDAWAVVHFIDEDFPLTESLTPSNKVGDRISYHVGSMTLFGILEKITFRKNPSTDSTYLYHVKVIDSNDYSVKPGNVFIDDEIYFFA